MSEPTGSAAIRWLIALVVLCCDPLVIALTAAASANASRGYDAMSKPKSYVRSSDGATMVEVESHQYVNAKILQLQGRNPAGQKQGEMAAASAGRSGT